MFISGSLALTGFAILASHSATKAEQTSKLSDYELIEALKKYSPVGKAHRALKRFKGEYEQIVKWWSAPGADPKEDRCTSATGWVLDGRFLTHTVKGQWLGIDFEGLATIGYDYGAESYVLTWIDSFHSRIMTSTGTFDKSSDTFTFQGTFFDAIDGKNRTVKTVLTIVGKKGAAHIELFDVTSPGKPFKFLEIDSKRRVRYGA